MIMGFFFFLVGGEGGEGGEGGVGIVAVMVWYNIQASKHKEVSVA